MNWLDRTRYAIGKWLTNWGKLLVIFAIISIFVLGKDCYEAETYDYFTYDETTTMNCDYNGITGRDFVNKYLTVALIMLFSYEIVKQFKGTNEV